MLTAFHPVAPSGESPLSMELVWWALEALRLLLPRGTNRRELSYLMQKPSGNSSFSPSPALTWAVVTRKTQSLHPNARKGKAVGSGLHASRGLEVHFLGLCPCQFHVYQGFGDLVYLVCLISWIIFFLKPILRVATFSQTQA